MGIHRVTFSPEAITRDPEGEARLLGSVAALSEKLYDSKNGVKYLTRQGADGARVVWFDVPGSLDAKEIQITDLFRPFIWEMGASPQAKEKDWRPIFAWMIP